MKKINKVFILFCFTAVFFGCRTLKEPDSVQKQLDYTDNDVVENEIKQIKEISEKDAVKALWRSVLLDNDEIISSCKSLVVEKLNKAVEEKDYHEGYRLLKSLDTTGYEDTDNYYHKLIDELYIQDVPGLFFDEESENKLPKTMEDCINATVTIWVDKGYKVQSGAGMTDIVIGSGFFIDKRGYLITNYHVIQDLVDSKYEGYSRLFVKLPSDMETKIPAKVVGYDPVIDLALVKVEIEPQFILKLGSSEDLSVGDKISVIGTPIGLEGTLTSGIVSSASRQLTTMGSVFQIDAAVNSGNSGGPMIDNDKKVQAIIFAGMLQFQGLNFAIPVEYLKQELMLLYKGGEIKHTWLSAFGHTKKVKTNKVGLEVQYVIPGGSASFSKLTVDDLITKIDGAKINSLEELQIHLMKYEPGTILPVTYVRDDVEYTVPVYLEERPEYPLEKAYKSDFISDSFIPIFGMQLVHASTTNRRVYKVVKVLPGSIADQNGFSENDSVTINDIKIDYEKGYLIAQLYVKRRKQGLLDINMVLGSSLDSPNYF